MMSNLYTRFGRNFRLGLLAGFLAMLVPAMVRAQLNVRWDPLLEPGCGGWAVSIEVSPFHSNWMLVGGDILATGLSTDEGWNWQQTSGFQNFELGDFTWHPTNPLMAWAGTLGGPYLSTDGGHTWTSKRSGMPAISGTGCTAPIQKVIFDPNNSNTLLAFGGNQRDFISPTSTTCYGAVWQSTNGGTSWTKLTTLGVVSGVEGANIRNACFAAGSSSIVYACSADSAKQLWISNNGGSSWTLSTTGLPNAHVENVQTHPTNASIAWVSLDGGYGIYETTNGGANWTACNTGLTLDSSVNIQAFAVAPSNGNVLYCSAQANTSQNSRTYSSTNGGASWNLLIDNDTDYNTIIGGTYDPNEVICFKFLSVDPNDATHVVGDTEGLVLESWNTGATWYDVCSFTANGHKRGKGYSGVCGTRCKWNPYTPGFVMPIGLDDSKLNRSADYMYSFTDNYNGLSTPFDGAFDVGFGPNNIIYVGTGYYPTATDAIAKSVNGGATWTNCARPAGVTGRNEGIYVSPADPTGNTVYSIVSNNSYNSPASGLYKTTNGGSSWTTLLSSSSTGVLYSISADPNNYNTIYVGGGNGIYKSTDGNTFTQMSGTPNPWSWLWSAQKVDPTNSNILFAVGFRNSTVYRYNGSTWTNIFNKYAAYDIAIDPNNDQRLVVCTHGYPGYDTNQGDGIWITTNGGSSWANYSTGLRILSASSLDFNPDHSGQLVLGTDGCGFYVTDLGTSTPFSGTATAIAGSGTTVIQAENYDQGGYNIAYHNSGPNMGGGVDNYRADNFGIKAEGTGHALTHLVPGEWLKYSVNVPSTGYYDITLNAMSTSAGGQFHVEMNGVNVTGPMAIGNTNGTWSNISARGVRMIAGTQYLKVYCEGAGADLDYISTALSTNGINITSVNSGAAYAVGMSSLGATPYIDEPWTVSVLTPTLQNLPMIQTAMSDATFSRANDVTFTLDQPGTVYIALDKRLTTPPGFMTDWTATTESADVNSGVSSGYKVYSKHFAAGSVTLGGNVQSPASGTASMYMVFIKRD